MKRLFIFTILMHCLVWTSIAQTKLEGEHLSYDENTVTAAFEVNSKDGVPSLYKEVILPYIYNGKDTLWFESFEVYGKGRYKRQMQEECLKGNPEWDLSDNSVLAGKVYHYESSVPLKRWMTSATLGIKRYMTGCQCSKGHEEFSLLHQDNIFKEPQMPARRIPEYTVTDVQPAWDFGNVDLLVKFTVNDIEMDPDIFENARTFGLILNAVDKIYSDERYSLQRIEVSGYASPEGYIGKNGELARDRANALVNYIIQSRPQYKLSRKSFRICNGYENWEGLRLALADYEIEEKDAVLEIIQSKDSYKGKKIRLKALKNGAVWKQLLDEIFPHLRTARFLGVYFDSVQDNAIDEINAANEMIRRGEFAQAYDRLLPFEGDFRAYNSIGVSLMMQGLFEEALPWFEKAKENGSDSAAQNIEAIKAELEYEAEQKKLIEEYLKKYE
ncbi:MAG: hypothetical protein IKY48_02105 [Bacteroidales bacterium]|nr:hypothetical protein [Bacteroidales bacterium]